MTNQENDNTQPTPEEEFVVMTFTYEILGKGSINGDDYSIPELVHMVAQGKCIGRCAEWQQDMIDAPTLLNILEAHPNQYESTPGSPGIDSTFFGLNPDGSRIEEA
jgi:hypothetical protein